MNYLVLAYIALFGVLLCPAVLYFFIKKIVHEQVPVLEGIYLSALGVVLILWIVAAFSGVAPA
ncbi:hypothetical protein [uncultured Oscillibacter sp.]|uniref:hypothetical protein n=1 Tax=uncultured Oscillibacter sp. TaxID=876091 RepID=UPI0025E1E0EC|nr:hypothetical protein [uncultured Oscillibacter sp.]